MLEVQKRCAHVEKEKIIILISIFFPELSEWQNMHLIVVVCCIGCLALAGAAQSDISTKETGQVVLALKDTQDEKSPTNQPSSFGWSAPEKDQVHKEPSTEIHDIGWVPLQTNAKSVQKRQVPLYPLLDQRWNPQNPSTIPLAPHLQYYGVPPQYQEFVNETLSRAPSGICQKEVP